MLPRLSRDGPQKMTRKNPRKLQGAPAARGICESGTVRVERLLLADAELADHGLIALGIVFLEVVEQAAALADQHEKSAARAVVFLVRLEVLRQLANPFAEQSDLNFRAAGIARMRAVLGNEGFLLLSG